MAFSQYSGGTTIIFGFDDSAASTLAAAIGLLPQNLKITGTPEFSASAKNEDGEIINYVQGPDQFAFSMEGFLENQTLFGAAKNFTFSIYGVNRLFIINSKEVTKVNVDYQKCTISGMSYLNVTQEDI
jgi:hypothetical protein